MKFLAICAAYLGVAKGLAVIFGPWIAGGIVGVASVVIVGGAWWWLIERDTPPVVPPPRGPVIDTTSRPIRGIGR